MCPKKVGILTFHCASNYGAVLQTYAMQTVLRDLGHASEVIDYRPGYVWYAHRPFRPRSINEVCISGTKLIKARRFDAFRAARLVLTPQHYRSLEELRSAPPSFDAYLCGSDQIWNPNWGEAGADPAFFLDFGPDEAVRIAYAASFGTPELPPGQRDRIAALLRRLDHVSVREDGAVALAQSLGVNRAAWLPDPSLLLSDYTPITAPAEIGGRFVYAYLLEDSPLASAASAFASAHLNARCVTAEVYRHWWAKGGLDVIHPSPERWLGLIAESEAVVTNSFHGTAFSILYRKPFVVVAWSGAHAWADARARSLLRRLGLEHRLVSDPDPAVLKRLLDQPEDWEAVHKRLALWRDEAFTFLKTALS